VGGAQDNIKMLDPESSLLAPIVKLSDMPFASLSGKERLTARETCGMAVSARTGVQTPARATAACASTNREAIPFVMGNSPTTSRNPSR